MCNVYNVGISAIEMITYRNCGLSVEENYELCTTSKKLDVAMINLPKPLVGIIGGLGPQASVYLYHLCIDKSRIIFNASMGVDYPHLLISNLPMPDIVSDTASESIAIQMILSEIQRLQLAGAEKIVIACNTVHLFEHQYKKLAPKEFISLIQLVLEQLLKENTQKVLLLASGTTLDSLLYETPMKEAGIKVVTPNPDGRMKLDGIIKRTIAGADLGVLALSLEQLIMPYLDDPSMVVVLGCTELPVIVRHSALQKRIKIMDCLDVLAKYICEYSYHKDIHS